MAYVEGKEGHIATPAVVDRVVDYHDRVRWGPILGGIVVAIAVQLVLSALGSAIGLTIGARGTDAESVGTGVGIWAILSLFISLFIGGWVMAATCGPMNSKTALLNGLILWATTLAISSWLLVSGVSGTFGIVASNAGEIINQGRGTVRVPDIDPKQAQTIAANAAKASWFFLLGSLLGLVASLVGSSAGARKRRVRTTTEA